MKLNNEVFFRTMLLLSSVAASDAVVGATNQHPSEAEPTANQINVANNADAANQQPSGDKSNSIEQATDELDMDFLEFLATTESSGDDEIAVLEHLMDEVAVGLESAAQPVVNERDVSDEKNN